MSQPWTKIGTVRKDSNGNNHLVINKDVVIMVDGKELDLGQFRSIKCFNTVESLQGLASQGKIAEDKLAERLDYIEQKRIKFDIVVPPSK